MRWWKLDICIKKMTWCNRSKSCHGMQCGVICGVVGCLSHSSASTLAPAAARCVWSLSIPLCCYELSSGHVMRLGVVLNENSCIEKRKVKKKIRSTLETGRWRMKMSQYIRHGRNKWMRITKTGGDGCRERQRPKGGDEMNERCMMRHTCDKS